MLVSFCPEPVYRSQDFLIAYQLAFEFSFPRKIDKQQAHSQGDQPLARQHQHDDARYDKYQSCYVLQTQYQQSNDRVPVSVALPVWLMRLKIVGWYE